LRAVCRWLSALVVRMVAVLVFAVPRGPATLAIHPGRYALDVVLFLPDRQALLQLVDDVAAGLEGLVAMRRRRPHPDRQLADREVADAVHARQPHRAELLLGFRQDLEALGPARSAYAS
jgi:hypothetical protein